MDQKYEFSNIYGQDAAVGHLQNALRTGRISHAYIICGEKGAGKMQMAQTFAKTLQCRHRVLRNGLVEPCDACHSCLQADNNSQPDILTIIPLEKSKDGALRIEEARVRVKDDVQIKPYSSDWKVYIIPDADKMNTQTQNMLLKTLEEPPAYAVLILLAQSTERFLPTVLSRCITLRLHPVDPEVIARHLAQDDGVPQDKALLCARLSHGNPRRAAAMAASKEYWQFRQDCIHLLRGIARTDTYTMLSFVTPLSRQQVDDFLDLCESWLRDLAVTKTAAADHLIFADETAYIGSAAQVLRLSDIQRALDAVQLAHERRAANGTDTQICEMLLLSLRTALRRSGKITGADLR